jgi:phage I-like protein
MLPTGLISVADVTLAEGKASKRIPVARLGKYRDRRYGEFAITRQDYDGWVKNLAHFNGEVPIDYDHGPERNASSEAAGWIKTLELDGELVMANVEFTPPGAQAIREGRWKYISPTFVPDLKDEQGRSLGPALKGAGLTNRPFLKRGMPAITLSEDPELQAASDTRRCMRLSTTTARALSLSEDVDETTLLSALDRAVILTEADHRELVERAEAGDKALTDLADTKFDTAFATAAKEGRATDAHKSAARALFDRDEAEGLKFLAELPQLVSTAPKAGTDAKRHETGDAPAGVDQERYELNARAEAIALSENIDYVDALERASAEFAASGREV